MCGFLITNRAIANLGNVTHYLSRRGPDHTSVYERNGVTFAHFLLATTGKSTPQPLIEDDVVCVYDGKIFGAEEFARDGDCLIPLYRRHGVDFVRRIAGEYAIALVDFREQRVLYYTDIFGTKPLYAGVDGTEWGISSYRSALERLGLQRIDKVGPAGHDFSLQQFKTRFDDWTLAFERAVSIRTSEKMFIGLSSGYDSGSIDCALRKLGARYHAFTVGTEACAGRESIRLPFRKVDLSLIEPSTVYDLPQDLSTHGLSVVCEAANQLGLTVQLSGHGADGVFASHDDSKKFQMVQKLPKNFYLGRQEQFLSKEEHVAGAHGIETRYPFLDRDVVQEFLWLTPELKNEFYKAPLHNYMIRNSYPFNAGEKLTFPGGLKRELDQRKITWNGIGRRLKSSFGLRT